VVETIYVTNFSMELTNLSVDTRTPECLTQLFEMSFRIAGENVSSHAAPPWTAMAACPARATVRPAFTSSLGSTRVQPQWLAERAGQRAAFSKLSIGHFLLEVPTENR
jgi:hypothetical protein